MFCYLLAVFVSLAVSGEEWTRFRGPDGSGVASGNGYPTEFGPARNVVWKQAVPPGKSSPVLTGTNVFLTAERGEELVVLCLDRKTGKPRWERTLRRVRREFQHTLNSGAVATPVTDGENVYAFFGNFGLVSYNAAGKERWRRPMGPFSSLWGMAASPVLAGGVLVMVVDGFGASYVAGYDVKTGKERWRKTRSPFALNYSTPALRRTAAGADEIVIVGPGKAVGYDPETGAERWSGKLPVASYVASAGMGNDLVFSLSYAVESVPSFDA
jgi:outer membrane protein assembly factor BamB